MFNLLLITPFFPPSAASGSFRALGFAKHLPKFGWNLTVIASGPRPWESNDPGLLQQVPRETRVSYVDFPLQEARRARHQVMQRLGVKGCTDVWNAPTLKKCREVVGESMPDAIMTSGPPHNVHLLGRALQKQFALPWVADFRDPWCSWGGEAPYAKNNFLLERYWEQLVFRDADLIVANTPNTAEMLKRVFCHAENRIATVPNGFDPISQSNLRRHRENRQSYALLHTGELYADRNPIPVAQALQRIAEKDRCAGCSIVLRLIGRCDAVLQKQLDRYADVVERIGPVPYAEALKAMEDTDVLVLLDSPQRRIGVPAKLYEYIGVGRPVLALAREDSDTARILRQSGLSHEIVTDWRNIDGIEEAVMRLISNNGTAFDRKVDIDSMSREYQAHRLSQLLEELAVAGPRKVNALEEL